MGVITIEIPQGVKRTYQISSESKAKKLIDSLDQMKAEPKRLRNLEDIVGIWADRTESAEDIARDLRRRSNSTRK